MLCNSCGKSLDNSDKAGRCPPCEEAYILKKQQEQEELEKNNTYKKRKSLTLEEIKEEHQEEEVPKAITFIIYIAQACLILSFFPILYYLNPQATLIQTSLLFLFIIFSIVKLRYVLELWFRLLHENVALALVAIIMPALLLRSLFVYDVKPIKQVTIISICIAGLFATHFYYIRTTGESISSTLSNIEENLSDSIIKKLPRSFKNNSY